MACCYVLLLDVCIFHNPIVLISRLYNGNICEYKSVIFTISVITNLEFLSIIQAVSEQYEFNTNPILTPIS